MKKTKSTSILITDYEKIEVIANERKIKKSVLLSELINLGLKNLDSCDDCKHNYNDEV